MFRSDNVNVSYKETRVPHNISLEIEVAGSSPFSAIAGDKMDKAFFLIPVTAPVNMGIDSIYQMVFGGS